MVTPKTETWKRLGKVSVSRDEKGRFVSWGKAVFKVRVITGERLPVIAGKRVAVYGTAVIGWERSRRRYEFYGNGRNLQRAIIQALQLPPRRRFVTVSAEEFLMNPHRYGTEGYWVDKEVES